MLEELLDRFGDPPKSVLNLLAVADLKVKAHKVYVKEIVERPEELRLYLYEKARLNPAEFQTFISRFDGRMRFLAGEKPSFLYRRAKNSRDDENVIELVGVILEEMQALREEEDK